MRGERGGTRHGLPVSPRPSPRGFNLRQALHALDLATTGGAGQMIADRLHGDRISPVAMALMGGTEFGGRRMGEFLPLESHAARMEGNLAADQSLNPFHSLMSPRQSPENLRMMMPFGKTERNRVLNQLMLTEGKFKSRSRGMQHNLEAKKSQTILNKRSPRVQGKPNVKGEAQPGTFIKRQPTPDGRKGNVYNMSKYRDKRKDR